MWPKKSLSFSPKNPRSLQEHKAVDLGKGQISMIFCVCVFNQKIWSASYFMFYYFLFHTEQCIIIKAMD